MLLTRRRTKNTIRDSSSPTVEIGSTETTPTVLSPIPISITFSKPVINFTVNDLAIGGGTATNFTQANPTLYTFDLSITGTDAVVDVPAGICTDYYGNTNSGASQFSISRPWYVAGGLASSDVVAAYQPKGANSLAESYVNLVNPGTHDLTAGNAPTIDENGWYFSGNKHLISDIVPAADWSAVVQVQGIYVYYGYGKVFGVTDGTNTWALAPITSGNVPLAYHGTQQSGYYNYGSGTVNGTQGIAGRRHFLNSAYLNTVPTGGSIPNLPIHIGRSNGEVTNWVKGYIAALAFYNRTLSDEEITTIMTASNLIPLISYGAETDWILTA